MIWTNGRCSLMGPKRQTYLIGQKDGQQTSQSEEQQTDRWMEQGLMGVLQVPSEEPDLIAATLNTGVFVNCDHIVV